MERQQHECAHGRYEQGMAAKHTVHDAVDQAAVADEQCKGHDSSKSSGDTGQQLKDWLDKLMKSNTKSIKTHHAAALMQCALQAKGNKLDGHLL